MARTYKKPPLLEAVCDFRFSSSQQWDWTIPGLFYEQIQDTFPNKNQINVVETRVDPNEGKVVQQSQLKMQFISADGAAVLQIGSDNLTIHQLRPYDGWENFKALIVKYLLVYYKIAHPEHVVNATLRYINRVVFPYAEIELEEYFRVFPQVPHPIPQVFPTFLLNVDVPYDSLHSILRIVFGTIIPENGAKLAYLMDLSMLSSTASISSTDEVSNWLEIAHTHIESAFDAAFTDKMHREVFEEEVHE